MGLDMSGNKVEEALKHVASIHPSVTQVTYGDDIRWQYTDATGVPAVFDKSEDISLLEAAADEAYDRGLLNQVIKL